MAVRFRAAARTHLGTVRTNNEDSALASSCLLVLADGMGGHAAGEVASVVALRVFAEVGREPGLDLSEALLQAGRQARRALVAMSDADPVLESLGTTLVSVVVDDDQILIGHIGDSRVYLLRDSAMYQVTTDHTHVQRLIEMGQLTAERARTHPYRAMLLKSLDDHSPGPDLDIIDLQLQVGDRVLLCSDGLSDYVSAEQIGAGLARGGHTEAAEALIEAALDAGTRDNVTVVVGDVEESTEPAIEDPDFVGAVGEQIGLSDAAARALSEALPALHLDPRAPWQGSGFEAAAPTPDAEPAADEAPSESAGQEAPAAEGAERQAGAADPEAGPDLPAVLTSVAAGAFTLVVLVLAALFLFS